MHLFWEPAQKCFIFLLQTLWPYSSQFCLAGRTTEKRESSDVLCRCQPGQQNFWGWMNVAISWAAVFAVPVAGNPGQGACCLLYCLNVALTDPPGVFSSSAVCFSESVLLSRASLDSVKEKLHCCRAVLAIDECVWSLLWKSS